jgi:hypothetical protein
LIHGF